MIRLFAVLEDVGSEYETFAPTRLSLTPFEGDCYFLDLEDGKSYDVVEYEGDYEPSCWKPYNGEHTLGEYLFNPETQEYINSPVVGCSWGDECIYTLKDGREISDENLDENFEAEWMLCQEYKDGLPVGKPYFYDGDNKIYGKEID